MKKLLALLLAALIALGVMGVAFAEEVQTVNVCIGSQPETLDPQLNSASDGSNYIKHLFEGLMKFGWDGEGVVLGVADNYTVSEDGLVYTFHIRDDAKWSDGQDLTAEDFLYSMKRLVDPATAAPYAGDMGKYILNGLEIVNGKKSVDELAVKVIDAKTIEITLVNNCPWFLEIMAFPTYYPVRKDIIEQYGDAWTTSPESLIGNGAYKLESYTMDEEIVMVPSETFYDADKVVCKRICFKLITDPNAKLAAMRAGEIDWADDYPSEELETLKAEGLFHTKPQLGTYYVNINNTVEPFTDARVRKAFMLAIDPQYLSDVVTHGTYLPATDFVGGGFMQDDGSDFADYETVIDRSDPAANIVKAQEYLAEAGYPNGEGFPTVTYSTNVSGVHLPTAEALVYMWKENLGVNVEIEQMEWNVLLAARRNGEHTMARDGWVADYGDPSNLLDLFTSYSGNNSTFYKNPDYDAIMQAAAATTDKAEHFKLLHDAEKLAFGEDAVCIPVYYYATSWICTPEIQGVTTYPTGEKLFMNAVK
ncbi:MAG: peptide ABC transporter substrate-binding protein [Christensenellales bacterium]|jgi:oligopeptide transport system substrate-binding protein